MSSTDAEHVVITEHDLHWWIDFAATRQWTFAKTYADSAPHHYIVTGRTPDATSHDMVRAARVIHTFGQPGKYYGQTKIHLHSPDGRFRWWTEDAHFTDATLVNRATTDLSYGIQNAPATQTGLPSPYDQIATTWDADHPDAADLGASLKQRLGAVRGTYPPHVLDLGCGTGRVLDLGLCSARSYAGVDSSTAMLNLLVRKHPGVAAIYPVDVRSALRDGLFTPGQFDWVFLDGAVDLSPSLRSAVEQVARRALIEVESSSWQVHDVTAASAARLRDTAAEMRSQP